MACGCSNGNKTCNEQLQCTPCKRLLGMIERGFYKRSINQIQGRWYIQNLFWINDEWDNQYVIFSVLEYSNPEGEMKNP